MKNRLSLIVWSVALGLVATGARADGIAEAPAAACCGTASFAGLYVGGAIGGGQHREKVTNTSPGAPAEGLSFKDTDNNFTFGGYVGYNFQRCCSPLVFGIEADFNYLNSKPRASDVEPQIVGFPVETTNLESKIDWFGTLRGRAGFVVHDHVLLYATAGLAYARVEHTLSDDCVGCGDPIIPKISARSCSPTARPRSAGRSAAAAKCCMTSTGCCARKRCTSTSAAKVTAMMGPALRARARTGTTSSG